MNRPSYKELWSDEYKDRDEQPQWIRNAVNGNAKFRNSEPPYSEEEELARKIMQMHARIAELEAAQKEAPSLLPELERGHHYCDDRWYSCPKAVDGCCDESRGDECDCGADDYNALLAKIIGLLTPEAQK